MGKVLSVRSRNWVGSHEVFDKWPDFSDSQTSGLIAFVMT